MKLPVKHEYFLKLKSGQKCREFRDAHLTFIDEETKEECTRVVRDVEVVGISILPKELRESGMFTDRSVIIYELEDP